MDLESLYKKDPALKLMGIKLISAEAGHSEMTMEVLPSMQNAFGICHGGFIYTLADSAFAYACNSHNFNSVAQGCTIDYVRPGKTGSTLTAVAVERSLTGRTGLYDITVTNEKQETIAYFRGKSFRIR